MTWNGYIRYIYTSNEAFIRGGSWAAATSKMERFVIIANLWGIKFSY